MTWDDVVRLASGLPDVAPSTSYGAPALKVEGKLLTRLRQEDGSLVLLDVPADERAMLIEAAPAVFHTTPHYDGYPMVLAYLASIEAGTVWNFLERRWRNIAPRRTVALWDAQRAGIPMQG